MPYGSTTNPITLNITGGPATSVAVASAASHGTATASGTTISYTPTTGYAGPDSFTYTATNVAGTSAPATATITVSPPTLTLSPATLPDGTTGAAYSQTATASGGQAPYTYSISAGTLPAGLSINPSTGLISGTPTGTGTSNFTVRAALDAVPGDFRFGSAVRGMIQLAGEPVARLPMTALFNQDNRPAVWIVNPADSTTKLVPIDVARFETQDFLVSSGLKDGDNVVVAGVQQLRPALRWMLLSLGLPS